MNSRNMYGERGKGENGRWDVRVEGGMMRMEGGR